MGWYWMEAHEPDFMISYRLYLIRTGQTSQIPASARSMGGLGDQKRSEPLAQIRPAGFELTEGLLTSHARKGGVSGEGV